MLSEERLRQAAHHAAQALEDSLPPPSQCHYDVSPEFRRNMKKLCRQAKRRPYRTVWKAVACAALVLILGSTSYLGLKPRPEKPSSAGSRRSPRTSAITSSPAALTSTRKITVTFCRRFQRAIRRMWLTKMVACARNCMSTSRVSTWHLKRSMLRKRARMSYLWMLMAWRSQRLWSKVFPATSMLTQWENSPVP